jgi:membrane protease subunit HflK
MAWNQPGGQNNPWGRRPGQGGADLDERVRNWQRRLESLLRPGRGGDRRPLFILCALGVLVWLASGAYQVKTAERGIILRFGRLVEVRPPGPGWHFPWPIESIQKVNVASVNSSSYQARVLTSDVNLVELRYAVQYQFKDPVKLLFGVHDPERTLNEVSESVVREVVGRSTVDEVLVGSTRPEITRRARELIQHTLDEYGTGITVTTVNLTDVQVPEPVIQAQRDANKALAEQDRAIKAAQADANSILPQAEGAAAGLQQQAQAYRTQVLNVAQAQAASFEQILDAYSQAPAVTRRRLYMDAIESVLSQAHKVVIDSSARGAAGANNLFYLPLDKLLEKGAARETQLPNEPAAAQKAPESVTVEAPRSRGER